MYYYAYLLHIHVIYTASQFVITAKRKNETTDELDNQHTDAIYFNNAI